MIQEICKDEIFLAQKAEPATPADLPIAQDLIDTLTARGFHFTTVSQLAAEKGVKLEPGVRYNRFGG